MTDEDEARRYREAAEKLLKQLDWCVAYLKRIRRIDLARSLGRNRDRIRAQLRDS